ncbi:MAG: SURF1 family protein [Pseudomonadota bacterium]
MQLGPYQFNPHWFVTVVTTLLLVLLLSLSNWQWNRAKEKTALESRHQQLDTEQNFDPATPGPPLVERHQRLQASGTYLRQQFLLDNRTYKGRAGYYVLTPLELRDGTLLLVNRGWVEARLDRSQLPDIPLPREPQVVQGRAHYPATEQLLLGDAGYEQPEWPRVVQRLEPQKIATILSKAVKPYTLRLSAEVAGGFSRDWPIYYGITPERHQGYAFQWFSLAVALLTIYIVVNLKRIPAHEQA